MIDWEQLSLSARACFVGPLRGEGCPALGDNYRLGYAWLYSNVAAAGKREERGRLGTSL